MGSSNGLRVGDNQLAAGTKLSVLCLNVFFEETPLTLLFRQLQLPQTQSSRHQLLNNMKAFGTLSARSGAKASASRAVTRRSSSVSQGSIIPRRVGIDVARTRQQRSPPVRRADTRPFVTYYPNQKGLSPSSSDPEPPNTQNHNDSSSEAVDLPDAEYHEIADQYMNTLQLTMEEVADRDAQQGLEVEYSVCLLMRQRSCSEHMLTNAYRLESSPSYTQTKEPMS